LKKIQNEFEGIHLKLADHDSETLPLLLDLSSVGHAEYHLDGFASPKLFCDEIRRSWSSLREKLDTLLDVVLALNDAVAELSSALVLVFSLYISVQWITNTFARVLQV